MAGMLMAVVSSFFPDKRDKGDDSPHISGTISLSRDSDFKDILAGGTLGEKARTYLQFVLLALSTDSLPTKLDWNYSPERSKLCHYLFCF